MGLIHKSFRLVLVLLLFLSSQSSSFQVLEEPSAYDVIEYFNFPSGILPKGVTGYELDSVTGAFSAFLNGTCSFSLEGSYQLRYRPTIKGVISKGKLSGLQGVSVKLWFVWVDIVEVSRSGDNLEFSVGIAGAAFSIDNFEESPQCGCGFDCVEGEKVESVVRGRRRRRWGRRRNPLVASS